MEKRKYKIGIFGLSRELTHETSDIIRRLDNIEIAKFHICEKWEKFSFELVDDLEIIILNAIGYTDSIAELLAGIKKLNSRIEIILVNFAPNYSLAIKALRFGVRDLIEYPTEKESLPEAVLKSIQFVENRGSFNQITDLQSLTKNLYSLVYTDDVTGLYNQRRLFIDLDQLLLKVNEGISNFALMFIDIDNFKKVNDNNGHIVGSQILNYLAKELRKILRETDMIYRYGGDEFIIIVENVTKETATQIGERVLLGIQKKVFHLNKDTKMKISVSIGLSMSAPKINNVKEIISMADQMMYKAKRNGKGALCVWDNNLVANDK